MDHMLAMALALLGIIGFVLWIARPNVPLIVRLVLAVPAILWLAVYCLIELSRSDPEVWSNTSQMSIWTILVIAPGIYVLVSKPKKPKAGGERSV